MLRIVLVLGFALTALAALPAATTAAGTGGCTTFEETNGFFEGCNGHGIGQGGYGGGGRGIIDFSGDSGEGFAFSFAGGGGSGVGGYGAGGCSTVSVAGELLSEECGGSGGSR